MNHSILSQAAQEVAQRYIRDAERQRNVEFELRFLLIQDSRDNNSRTLTEEEKSIAVLLWNRVMEYLSTIPNVMKRQTKTSEVLYHRDAMGTLRHITPISPSGLPTYIMKQQRQKWDYNAFGIRMSLSIECPMQKPFITQTIELKRDKDRVSFIDPLRPMIQFDLTRVVSKARDGPLTVSHEFEMEWIAGRGGTVADLGGMMHEMLQVLQQSPFVMSIPEKRSTLYELQQLVGKRFFMGAQPVSLHREDLQDLVREPYSITVKLDGERTLVFVRRNGSVVFIDRMMQVRLSGVECKSLHLSLLDAELDANGVCHVFDSIYYEGTNLRGNVEYDLAARMELASKACKALETPRFQTKSYYWNLGDMDRALKDLKAHDSCDGLIFTPVRDAYPMRPTWNKLYKWKPPHLNTVDLKMVPERPNPSEPECIVGHVAISETETTPMKPHSKVLWALSEPMRPHCIAECSFDKEKKAWIPIRVRKDKCSPNFNAVAENVWQATMDPVTQEDLLEVAQKEPAERPLVEPYTQLRAYHNHIKGELIRKTMRRLETMNKRPKVLDLACGRGGDVFKWDHPDMEYYVGVDCNATLIREAERRSSKLCHFRPRFHVQDLEHNVFQDAPQTHYMPMTKVENFDWAASDDELEELQSKSVLQEPHFNVISMQFCLHYFFGDMMGTRRLLSTIETNLSDKGYLLLTFMDGHRVYELVQDRIRNVDILIGHEVVINVDDPETSHGFSISLGPEWLDHRGCLLSKHALQSLKGGASLQVRFPQSENLILNLYEKREYLLFPEQVVQYMAALSLHVSDSSPMEPLVHVKEKPHGQRTKWSQSEVTFSQLNRAMIFQRHLYPDPIICPHLLNPTLMVLRYKRPYEALFIYLKLKAGADIQTHNRNVLDMGEWCIRHIQENTEWGLHQFSADLGDLTAIVRNRDPSIFLTYDGYMIIKSATFSSWDDIEVLRSLQDFALNTTTTPQDQEAISVAADTTPEPELELYGRPVLGRSKECWTMKQLEEEGERLSIVWSKGARTKKSMATDILEHLAIKT